MVFRSRRIVGLVFALVVTVGAFGATAVSAQQNSSTPQATPDPMTRYADIEAGRQDGFIVFANHKTGDEVTVYCIGGEVNFVTHLGVGGDLSIVGFNPGLACTARTFDGMFPGNVLVSHDDPKEGWVITDASKGPEEASRCLGSALITVRKGTPDPEYKVERGLPACAGNPVG